MTKLLNLISLWALPVILLVTLTCALVKKVPMYEEFTEGAKDGFKISVKIIPYLVEMFAASDVLFKKVNHQEYVDFSLEFSKMDCGHGIDKLLEFCGSIKQ